MRTGRSPRSPSPQRSPMNSTSTDSIRRLSTAHSKLFSAHRFSGRRKTTTRICPPVSGTARSTARPKNDMTVHGGSYRPPRSGRERHHDHRPPRKLLAVFDGFVVQSLSASSRMSADHIDKGLYEIQWCENERRDNSRRTRRARPRRARHGSCSSMPPAWARPSRRNCAAAVTAYDAVDHQPVDALTEVDGGYLVNPQRPEQIGDLFQHLGAGATSRASSTAGRSTSPAALHWRREPSAGRIHHPASRQSPRRTRHPQTAAVPGHRQRATGARDPTAGRRPGRHLGAGPGHRSPGVRRTLGWPDRHRRADDRAHDRDARICDHLLDDGAEDQIAIRGHTTFVPRLRPCASLTKPFPTKLTPDATYVVTGGAGALGRAVAAYLAERGARHITLLSRSADPTQGPMAGTDRRRPALRDRRHNPGDRTPRRPSHHRQCRCRRRRAGDGMAERPHAPRRSANPRNHPRRGIGRRPTARQHERSRLRRGVAPKITGTRVLHDAFKGHDLEFFVMFGSAGSIIASPGQGNYAAANAFLDAFAHYRQAQGLPALTIGWGPWSVGMVEELKLEKIYAQRGIELITPAVGTRILDRLINQKNPTSSPSPPTGAVPATPGSAGGSRRCSPNSNGQSFAQRNRIGAVGTRRPRRHSRSRSAGGDRRSRSTASWPRSSIAPSTTSSPTTCSTT